MEDKSPRYFEEYQIEEIDLLKYLRRVMRNWKTVAIWACAGIIAGLVIAVSLPKSFTVHSTLAPEFKARTTSSSVSSLASLAGISSLAIGNTDAMYPYIYPDLIASEPFLVGLLTMPVEFKAHKETVSTDLYDYILHYQKRPWWSALLSLPGKIVGSLVSLVKSNDSEEGEDCPTSEINPSRLTRTQASVIKSLRKAVKVDVDKKTYVVSIDVSAQDPVIAKELSDLVIANLKERVTQYRTEKARGDMEYFARISDEAKENYYRSQRKYASFVDSHQGVVLKSVQVEEQRLQTEMAQNREIFLNLYRQFQAAEAKVQECVPVFFEVRPPTVPLKGLPSRSKVLMGITALAALLGAAYVMIFKKEEEN